MPDNKTELEMKTELEKENINVPEETLQANRTIASSIAKKLWASKAPALTASQMQRLKVIGHRMHESIVAAGIVPAGSGNFKIWSKQAGESAMKFAEEFEEFTAECDQALSIMEDKQLTASEQLVILARKIASCDSETEGQQLLSSVREIIADASKRDIMLNLSNIETKSNKDQTLKLLLDWKDVARLSPNVTRMTKVQDLKVQDLKNLLVSLRGGKESKTPNK